LARKAASPTVRSSVAKVPLASLALISPYPTVVIVIAVRLMASPRFIPSRHCIAGTWPAGIAAFKAYPEEKP